MLPSDKLKVENLSFFMRGFCLVIHLRLNLFSLTSKGFGSGSSETSEIRGKCENSGMRKI